MGFSFGLFANLMRSLFPNWNFFDRIAHSFELQFKTPDAKVWRPLSENTQRPLWGLFFNPRVNLRLAEESLLVHFAREVQELQDDSGKIDSTEVRSLTTFILIKSLLEIKIRELNLEAYPIQFKLVAINSVNQVDLYISDWISWETP